MTIYAFHSIHLRQEERLMFLLSLPVDSSHYRSCGQTNDIEKRIERNEILGRVAPLFFLYK